MLQLSTYRRAALLLIGLACGVLNTLYAEESDSPPEHSGVTHTVQVIVQLAMDWQPEGLLQDADAVVLQRTTIAQQQQALLESLQFQQGTAVRLETVPLLIVQIEATELEQLEKSPLVLTVQVDSADQHLGGQTVSEQLQELERVYQSSHSYATVNAVTISPDSTQNQDVRGLMADNFRSVGIEVQLPAEPQSAGQVRAAETKNCTLWSLGKDYLNYPNQKNPNPDSCGNQDVWHFMQTTPSTASNHDPKTYVLMKNFTTSAYRQPFNDPYFFHWAGPEWASVGGMPFFGRTSGVNRSFACSPRYMPANTMVAHPAPVSPLIIGWKSPVTGTVSVTGATTSLDGGTIVWYVDKNSTNLAYGWTANGSTQYFSSGTNGSNLTYVKVEQGDFIYLGIDPYGNLSCDTTALSISIQLLPIPVCRGITDGLVACYPFEDNAFDGSGNGNHGTATWNTAYKTGKVGKAIDLNLANTSYVHIPNPAQKFDQQYTVSGWILVKGLTHGTPFSKYSYNGNGANGYSHGFILVVDNGSSWGVYDGNNISHVANYGYSPVASPTYTLPLNQFKYVTAVYDNGKSRLYVDGKLKGETLGNPVTTLDNSYPILIGIGLVHRQIASYSQGFNGMIDELRVYNRALSDTEVQQLAILSGVEPAKVTLTVTKSGNGTVTAQGIICGTDCNEDLELNASVTLTATADAGYLFKEWTGECTGTSAILKLTMDKAKTCTAQFIPAEVTSYTLNVAKTGTGKGTVRGQIQGQAVSLICKATCTTAGQNYLSTATVNLTAAADKGSVFKGWTCDGTFRQTSTPTLIKVPMDKVKTCTAQFQ